MIVKLFGMTSKTLQSIMRLHSDEYTWILHLNLYYWTQNLWVDNP